MSSNWNRMTIVCHTQSSNRRPPLLKIIVEQCFDFKLHSIGKYVPHPDTEFINLYEFESRKRREGILKTLAVTFLEIIGVRGWPRWPIIAGDPARYVELPRSHETRHHSLLQLALHPCTPNIKIHIYQSAQVHPRTKLNKLITAPISFPIPYQPTPNFHLLFECHKTTNLNRRNQDTKKGACRCSPINQKRRTTFCAPEKSFRGL